MREYNRKTSDYPDDSLEAMHAGLHEWYARRGRRDLPWRNTRDPYHIYLSEVMLQQTQVKTVLERYYHPFLARFPTLADLARAPREAVMKAWEGLGYYTRAGNLHRAAQACGGSLPRTVEGLLALPGIGRNTAHAIATFAYRQQVPVMEANVKRVLSRVFALRAPKPEELWQKAAQLLDARNPFDYNQAMMDIGALVCTRTKPACTSCPLAVVCEGKSNPSAYPAAAAKKKVPTRRRRIVVVQNARGQVWLAPREGKFLHGLYGFCETDPKATHLPFAGRRVSLARATALGRVKQTYSHFTLAADVKLLKVANTAPLPAGEWVGANRLAALPLSRADQKVVALLAEAGRR